MNQTRSPGVWRMAEATGATMAGILALLGVEDLSARGMLRPIAGSLKLEATDIRPNRAVLANLIEPWLSSRGYERGTTFS